MATGRRLAGVTILLYVGALAANRSQVVVRGRSMEPSLWPGDRLVTLPAIGRALRAGQVVVVADPTRPDHLVVKRIASVADGRVDVRGDASDRSTDSRTWGSLPVAAVRRIAVARWPDVRTPLHHAHPTATSTPDLPRTASTAPPPPAPDTDPSTA